MGRRPSVNNNLPARMRARRQRSGRVFYYYDTGGTPRREIPLGDDYVLAVKQWADLHQEQATALPTVAWAVAKYLASQKYTTLSAGTQADYKFAIDKIIEHFGDAPLDEVKPSHLNLYLEKRGRESLHRAQREVAVFGRIFKYARSMDWTKNDPKESVELERLPGRKAIYIYDEMFDAVYAAGCPVLREALDVAYLLGQRPIDVLALREPHDGVIELRQTKTGAPIRIAVSGDLADALERIAARKRGLKFRLLDGPLLVDERGRSMTKHKLRARFEKARLAAGISGAEFQFRDLRAKAATDLRDQVNLEAAQALLGHASITMTEHYTRARRGKIRTAIPRKPARNHGV